MEVCGDEDESQWVLEVNGRAASSAASEEERTRYSQLNASPRDCFAFILTNFKAKMKSARSSDKITATILCFSTVFYATTSDPLRVTGE